MNRRNFLALTSQAGMALSLSQLGALPALAKSLQRSSKTKNLITIHANGGWDVLLALDPKVKNPKINDQSCFIGYGEDEIVRAAGLQFGPSAAALAPFANNCVVINGVYMLGNVDHVECSRMAHTGILERRTPLLTGIHAAKNNSRVLAIGGEFPESYGLEMSYVETSDLMSLKGDDFKLQAEHIFNRGGFLEREIKALGEYSQRFKATLEQFPELASKIPSSFSNGSFNATLNEATIAQLIAGLKCGYLTGAHLILNPEQGFLDSHTSHKNDHSPALKNVFDQVINLVSALKDVPGQDGSSSLFDETLILVTSEFSRESALNSPSVDSGGKEHNGNTNSYLLIGGSLRGGYTIGESVLQYNMMGKPSIHTARNYDFTCGRVIRTRKDNPMFMNSDFRKQIQPGHVVRSLARTFGAEKLLDPSLKDLPWFPLSF